MSRGAAVLAAALCAALIAPLSASASLITPSDDASAVAAAMSSQAGLVTAASFPADATSPGVNPSSGSAAGVAHGFVGTHMPTDGATSAALTSGDVTLADPPNNSSSSGVDNVQAARSVHDLTVLRVDVKVPAGDNCLGVDTVFYSEEYPEFVGTSFNDAFIAELDSNDWTYDTGTRTISAPHNFAFDEGGNPLSVNSVSFTDGDATGLQYDGSTRLLSAQTAVTPGSHTLYFSIYDAGDGIYDSAVLLDNLRTYHAAQCQAGSDVADDDGDGLPNSWETAPVDTNGDGTTDLDLSAMGADPNHKDLFVELDSMPGLRLEDKALAIVANSFNNSPVSNPDGTTGIHIHVDNGPGSVMNPVTGQTWGALSHANTLPAAKVTGSFSGSNYSWSTVDQIKHANFSEARAPAFRYAMSVNRYGSASNTSSGIARDIPGSDFVVALGSWCAPEGTCLPGVLAQAGTFMHELGHTLGLHHGGQVDTNYVPNYLSIMNYMFQISGLNGSLNIDDYSRYDASKLGSLDESDLNEPDGFSPTFSSAVNFTTFFRCYSPNHQQIAIVAPSVDFNCDGDSSDVGVSRDLNGDGSLTVLRSYDDWRSLQFRGGAVGGLGLSVLLNDETVQDEAPSDELQQNNDLLVPPPDVQTGGTTGVTDTTATLNGTVNPNGKDAEVRFAIGTDAASMTFTDYAPVGAGTTTKPFSADVSSLKPDTTYVYRAVVRTDAHLLFGAIGTFTTSAAPTQPGPPPAQATEPPGAPIGSTSKPPAAVHKPAVKKPKKVVSCTKLKTRSKRRACVLAREQKKCRPIKSHKKKASCLRTAKAKARRTK